MLLGLFIITASQLLLCSHREGKVEGRTFTRLTFNPNAPTVTQDSKTTESQTNPKPSGLVLAAQARELIKDPVLIRGRNTRAIILHPHVYPIVFLFCTGFQLAVRWREFAGIFH